MTSTMKRKIEMEEKERQNQKEAGKMEMAVYQHECAEISQYHMKKYKHWAKVISAVDTTKTNGFAFIGEWLSKTNEELVPEGSLVVEFRGCEGKEFHLFRMTENGKEEIAAAPRENMVDFVRIAAEELERMKKGEQKSEENIEEEEEVEEVEEKREQETEETEETETKEENQKEEEEKMRETEIFEVPVRKVEEILPDVFDVLVEMFKEFVEDDMNTTNVQDYRDWRKYGSVEVIVEGGEIEYIPVWPKKEFPGNDIPWARDNIEDIEQDVLDEIFQYREI